MHKLLDAYIKLELSVKLTAYTYEFIVCHLTHLVIIVKRLRSLRQPRMNYTQDEKYVLKYTILILNGQLYNVATWQLATCTTQ